MELYLKCFIRPAMWALLILLLKLLMKNYSEGFVTNFVYYSKDKAEKYVQYHGNNFN